MCYIDVAGRKKVHCGWVRGQPRWGCVVCVQRGCIVGASYPRVGARMVCGWARRVRVFCVCLSVYMYVYKRRGCSTDGECRSVCVSCVCRCSVSRDDRSAPECIQYARVRVRVFTTTHFHLHHFTPTLRLHSPRQYETGPLAALVGQVREPRLYGTWVGPARSTGWFCT